MDRSPCPRRSGLRRHEPDLDYDHFGSPKRTRQHYSGAIHNATATDRSAGHDDNLDDCRRFHSCTTARWDRRYPDRRDRVRRIAIRDHCQPW